MKIVVIRDVRNGVVVSKKEYKEIVDGKYQKKKVTNHVFTSTEKLSEFITKTFSRKKIPKVVKKVKI